MNDIKKIVSNITTAIVARTGYDVAVEVEGPRIEFRVDAGPRLPSLGGFVGGVTSGSIGLGELFPRMETGVDPIGGVGGWYKIMYE